MLIKNKNKNIYQKVKYYGVSKINSNNIKYLLVKIDLYK